MRPRTRKPGTTLLCVGSILFLSLTAPALAIDAPETINIDVMSKFYGPVTFDHAMHVDYASCEECHHHTTGEIVADPNCARCHTHHDAKTVVSCSKCHVADRFNQEYISKLEDPELYHLDKPGLKGAYHLNCVSCHVTTSGPTGCVDCHALTEAGEKLYRTGAFTPETKTASGKEH